VTTDRFKLGAWLVTEDRDDAYDGSSEVENPMKERTRIRVPLVTFDVRFTQQFGVQVAATVPDVTGTEPAFIEVRRVPGVLADGAGSAEATVVFACGLSLRSNRFTNVPGRRIFFCEHTPAG